jgi:hypothetical protein
MKNNKNSFNNWDRHRRQFLCSAAGTMLLALGGSLLAGCGGGSSSAVLPNSSRLTGFNATYSGVATSSAPDTSGNVQVTSTLADPNASFGLTEARFTQTVFVAGNPNTLTGTSIFQPTGGTGADKLFTSYSGTGTPANPPGGVQVSNFTGTFTVTGGTGRFSGATGTGTFTGQANVVTGAVTVNFTSQ